MPNAPSIFSFFSGVGFLDLGFETGGYQVVFVNEIHEPFMNAYHYSRGRMGIRRPGFAHLGDINSLLIGSGCESESTFSDLLAKERARGGLIGFIGGPPCPDFSVGGKNRGRNGENGRLSETYIRLICERRPDFFLFENVKGLFRTRVHREFFEELKTQVHNCGYVTTQRLINTIEYGVPQDRDRIIMIGFGKKVIERLGLLDRVVGGELQDGVFDWRKHAKYHRSDVMALPWPRRNPFEEDSSLEAPPGIPLELTVEYWFRTNSVETHPNAGRFFKPRNGLRRFQTIDEGDDSRKSFKRLHRWRYSPTVCYGNNEVHLHPYKPRRLSVAEALALQSLPREFELPPTMSLSNAFKAIGNGVPYLAAKEIATTLLEFLEGRE